MKKKGFKAYTQIYKFLFYKYLLHSKLLTTILYVTTPAIITSVLPLKEVIPIYKYLAANRLIIKSAITYCSESTVLI